MILSYLILLQNMPVSLRNIKSGEMMQLGDLGVHNGTEWIEVISNSNIIGYIKGDTMLLDSDKYCYIAQEFVRVYENPHSDSVLLELI